MRAPIKSKLRVLIIDDDEADRLSLKRTLRQSDLDCEVDEACTAIDGLEKALSNPYDAILLDFHLPDQDGINVLHSLRNGHYAATSVIVISCAVDDDLAARCIEAGAQDFILKDEVSVGKLTRTVKQSQQRFAMEMAFKASKDALQKLSEHDPLTGLINRRGFEIALESAILRSNRNNVQLAVMLLDLDDFKSVNDTLGHDKGDILLKEVAMRLSNTIRDSDFVCRLGGDEFVILMCDFESSGQTILLADRVLEELRRPVMLSDNNFFVSASIGIALYDRNERVSDLLKFADVAMYKAKHDGRNQYHFYSEEMQEIIMRKVALKNDLMKAISNNELRLFYQAQISAVDGSVGGVEALVRWQHPSLGLLAPGAFIEIAEESSLILDIGNWVLNEACSQLNKWRLANYVGENTFSMAINISAIQLKNKHIFSEVQSAIALHKIESAALELEITESAIIKNKHEIVRVLENLTHLGVQLSLDDFGTGYSSIDHLKLFPVQIMKIDRSYVSSIGLHEKSDRILKAIIAFAKTLEMTVIAEGVETQSQADFCKQCGCDFLQGFFYSIPTSAIEFEKQFFIQPQQMMSV